MELPADKITSARKYHEIRAMRRTFCPMCAIPCLIVVLLMLFGEPENDPPVGLIVFVAGGLGLVFLYLAWDAFEYPVRWLCPQCNKRIHAKEPWRCGVCDHENKKISWEGAHSFLGRCSNDNCQANPTAYQCQHCRHVMCVTLKQDDRNPAQSLNAAFSPAVTATSYDDVQAQRARELADKEHNRRHLEADQKLLVLEIKNARLRKTLTQPEPVTTRQQSINRIAEQLDDADLFCRTIPDTVERELKMHAEVVAKQFFPDAEKDAYIKTQMKEAISLHFESIRLTLGGNVQVQKEDRR